MASATEEVKAIAPSPMEKVQSNTFDDVTKGEIQDISILDEAEAFLRDNGYDWAHVHALLEDESTTKNILRKIDWTIMPLLCGTFMLQYIDKSALAYSAVFDLFTNAHITGDQYSWLGSLFYFGYLFFEYPGSYLGQHFRTGKVVGIDIIIWGCILMLTAACTGFGGLAACRFLLGCSESLITPIFMMIVGTWYRRQEQPARAGIFYAFNGVGSICGGIITYCIGLIDGFPIWKLVFLICGAVTTLWGVVALTFLPDSPLSAKRFTVEEKVIIIGRNKANQTGIQNKKFKLSHIKEALMDVQVWILFFYAAFNEVVNGGVANFGKLIIKSVVSDSAKTVALGIPQGAFQTFYIIFGCWLATKLPNARCYVMMASNIPTIIGACILWKLPRTYEVGCLFGYYIVGSFVTGVVLAMQMPAANLGGYTKRVTATAFVFLGYCLGNIIGPHAFLATEAPIYRSGCITILSCSATQICLIFYLRCHLQRRNRKRDEAAAVTGVVLTGDEVMTDITDFENPHFRYLL